METIRTFRNIKYLLIMCISISLILSQASGIHMHVQHSDHPSVFSEHVSEHISEHFSEHIIDIHSASGPHVPGHDLSHNDSLDHAHHSAAIDISPDSLVKKSGSLTPLILFIFFSWLLLAPLRRLFNRWVSYQQQLTPFTRQLLPPLRAPPSF